MWHALAIFPSIIEDFYGFFFFENDLFVVLQIISWHTVWTTLLKNDIFSVQKMIDGKLNHLEMIHWLANYSLVIEFLIDFSK